MPMKQGIQAVKALLTEKETPTQVLWTIRAVPFILTAKQQNAYTTTITNAMRIQLKLKAIKVLAAAARQFAELLKHSKIFVDIMGRVWYFI